MKRVQRHAFGSVRYDKRAELGITSGMTDRSAAQGDLGRSKIFRRRQPRGKQRAGWMSGDAKRQTGTQCGA
jgi:hypothetical protein